MTIKETLQNEYEKTRNEWLKTLTFTGIKNEKGLKAYENMVKAGEALDKHNFPNS